MNHDKDDSDFEVCLTSSEYNRILAIERQCKKERELFKQEKQELLTETQYLKRQLKDMEEKAKERTKEIDDLSVQCLKLKKLRLLQEDEIRTLKEQHLKLKEQNLSELELSVRENKEMKELKLANDTMIDELKTELLASRQENSRMLEETTKKTKENQKEIQRLQEKEARRDREHQEIQKRSEYFENKANDLETKLEDNLNLQKKLKEEIENATIRLEESQIKQKEEKEHFQSDKMSLEKQLAMIKEDDEQLLRQKEAHIQRLQEENLKIKQGRLEVNRKMMGLMHMGPMPDPFQLVNEKPQESQPRQLFSARIYEILKWAKDGILSSPELKEQIERAMDLEKEYEDIISSTHLQKNELREQIKRLESRNKELASGNDLLENQHRESAKLLETLSDMRVKSEDYNQMTEIMVLREEIEGIKKKLGRTQMEFDDSVKSYNNTISDSQLKHQNQMKELDELRNENQAFKLMIEDRKELINEFLAGYESKLKMSRIKGAQMTPELVLKIFKTQWIKYDK